MSSTHENDFYVGYLPEAPPGLGRWLRPRVAGLLIGALALAAVLAIAQAPFARATFEYGTTSTLQGVLWERPVPLLVVDRPGDDHSYYLLTSLGKHGAADAVRGRGGRRVEVSGTLIYRDGQTMIELAENGIRELDGEGFLVGSLPGHAITLRGEIVDSKCFLGVMKPGNLKPHRACAVRCISGGVPPVLLVRDPGGNASYYLLVGPGGRAINAEVLPYVAEPIEVTGVPDGYPDPPILTIDPADIRRLP